MFCTYYLFGNYFKWELKHAYICQIHCRSLKLPPVSTKGCGYRKADSESRAELLAGMPFAI
jgi:hypothetical protein